MACSGGWDWAPYSSLVSGQTPLGVRSLAKGIWKSVYIVPVSAAAITDVAPLVFYTGAYPTVPLTPATQAAFNVSVRVFFSVPDNGAAINGTLTIASSWSATTASTSVTLRPGSSTVTVTLVANPTDYSLWWPNGLGQQPLYDVIITWAPTSPASPVLSTTRRIGFRVFALVTDDDSDPSSLSGVNGSGNLTMRFKVNGANIWARGANWIPMVREQKEFDFSFLVLHIIYLETIGGLRWSIGRHGTHLCSAGGRCSQHESAARVGRGHLGI